MTILYIVILLLVMVIIVLAITLLLFAKKSTYLCDKEKEYIIFVMDIFKEYADDLGIQSKEQHKKLVEELEKIKTKHLKK